MVVLWKGIAAAAAAGLMLSGVAAGAAENEPPNQTLLFFAGSDFWKDGDFLHGGLLEAPFQEDVERHVQKLLVALLLLLAGRSSHTRAGDLQIGVLSNFLALLRKESIMERSGTIIHQEAMYG